MFLNTITSFFDASLLVTLLLLPLLLSIIITRKSFYNKKSSRLPPSPPKLPFIGNLHLLGSTLHLSLQSLSKKHGPLMLLQLGHVPALVVSSADAARDIMKTHDIIFASRPSLKSARILTYGCRDVVFAPYGEHWRQMRKICVNNLLSAKIVQSFKGAREEEVASMIDQINKEGLSADSNMVNVSEALNLLANKVLCRAVLGKPLAGHEAMHKIFCQLAEENAILLDSFSIEDCFPRFGWLDKVFGFERRAMKTSRRWDDTLEAVIEEHLKRYEDKDSVPESEDFVDVLLALQNAPSVDIDVVLDRELIKLLLMDMIAAGTDTTFIALDWCMAELIHSPKAMKKLQDEVRGICIREAKVREEDLSEMNYLKAVIKEVLRMHSPVPLLLPRESMETCQIQGFEIPIKTRVMVNAWAIGRDPKTWDAPDEFRPERFLDSGVDFKGKDFQFIPFGAGRRICPGIHFAVPTLELALANLMHQFDWKLPEGMEVEDLDMNEAPGLAARRKEKLYLVAKPALIM